MRTGSRPGEDPGMTEGVWFDAAPLRQAQGRLFDKLRAGSPLMGFGGLGRALPVEGSLPCETLPLGAHKGHPYNGTQGRLRTGSSKDFGPADHERLGQRRTLGDLGHGWVHAAFPNQPAFEGITAKRRGAFHVCVSFRVAAFASRPTDTPQALPEPKAKCHRLPRAPAPRSAGRSARRPQSSLG